MSFGEYLGAGSGITKGLWHFNDAATDASGNGNTLTLAGGIGYTAGKFNNCLNSTAQTTYATISSVVTPADGDYTFLAWFKTAGSFPQLNGTLVNISDTGGNHEARMDINRTTYNLNFNTYEDGYGSIAGVTTGLNDSLWHCCCVTKSGTTGTIYLDGKYENSGTVKNVDTTARTQVGSLNGYYTAVGLIDEVIIENVAWTAARIKQYFTYAKGRFGVI